MNQKIKLDEILDFRKVVAMINQELRAKGLYEIEYLLVSNSISFVFEVLEKYSTYYQTIKDDCYSNGARFSELLEYYLGSVQRKYRMLFIDESKNDKLIDKYYNKTLGRKNIQDKNNIGMVRPDVQKTLLLMREAVHVYYRVYYNKMLIAELNSQGKEKERIEFQIKERELLHLLGVSAWELRNNPDFIRLTGKKPMNSLEILEWILRDIDGNNDLIQCNEDFLKRMATNPLIINDQFSKQAQSSILNYHKVAMKSQAFINAGPLENVSLVAKLNEGKKISENTNSDIAIITNSGFKKYPWAVFGSAVGQDGRRYFETLNIKNTLGRGFILTNSTPAVIKSVQTASVDNKPVSSVLFSPEEQFEIFYQAYENIGNNANFEQLKNYFKELYEANTLNPLTTIRKK